MKKVYYLSEPGSEGVVACRHKPGFETRELAEKALQELESNPKNDIVFFVEEVEVPEPKKVRAILSGVCRRCEPRGKRLWIVQSWRVSFLPVDCVDEFLKRHGCVLRL